MSLPELERRPSRDAAAADSCSLETIRSPALRAAVRRIAEESADPSRSGHGEFPIRELIALARAIESDEPDAPRLARDGAGPLLPPPILDRFRAELLLEWARAPVSPPTPEMLRTLQNLERLRGSTEPEPVDADSFAMRLLRPDGLELAIELAHDLRSPLTSILFLAETLRRGRSGPVSETQRRQLGIIYSAALGLISVASDVMELARSGDRLTETEPSPFSVTEILQSVADIVQPMAEEKGLTIRLLPPDADRRLGYPVALSRVLLNLTSNALKFTDEGFIEIVAHPCAASRVEFSVRDTGNGIDPDVVASLYQPFRPDRHRASGWRFSGTGLGLAICRKLLAAMDSELRFETRRGWGTRFFFELHLPPAALV
jgi:signal transduction histidine kinase